MLDLMYKDINNVYCSTSLYNQKHVYTCRHSYALITGIEFEIYIARTTAISMSKSIEQLNNMHM